MLGAILNTKALPLSGFSSVTMNKQKQRFTVILDPEQDSGYSVHCPALPGCVSQGDDRQSALENIKEAIVLLLETIESEGFEQPPQEDPKIVADEIREVLDARFEEGLALTIETAVVEQIPFR